MPNEIPMADDPGDKEDKFDFTADGEALGYISLDQARVLAMGAARDAPGDYGRAFRDASMAFAVTAAEETEDYYEITLTIRPQGQFSGTPGQEQFFIDKDGTVAHRQVLAVPRSSRGFPIIPAIIGLAVVVAVAAVVLAIILLPRGEELGSEEPNAAGDSLLTPVPTASDSSTTAVPATAVPATAIPATTIPRESPTTAVATVPPGDLTTALGLTGRYVNADDPSEFLEINPDGTFSWVLPGKGIDLSGVWTGDGGGIALDTRVALSTKRIEGRELFDPDGNSWEKYEDQGDVVGTYLRLNFEQLGDYLELLPDGSFIAEESGVTSKGTWRSERGELVLALDAESSIATRVEDGAIIDAAGVKWVKQ